MGKRKMPGRADNHWTKHIDFMALDIVMVVLAYNLALYIRFRLDVPDRDLYTTTILFLILVMMLIDMTFGTYRNILRRSRLKELAGCARYAAALLIILTLFNYFTHFTAFSRTVAGLFFVLSFAFMLAARLIHKQRLIRKYGDVRSLKNLLLIGDADSINASYDYIYQNRTNLYNLMAVYVLGAESQRRVQIHGMKEEIPVLIREEDMYSYVQKHVIDEVIISSNNISAENRYAHELCLMGKTVHVSLNRMFRDMPNTTAEEFAGLTVLTSGFQPISPGALAIKRLGDICGSIVGLIICGACLIIFGPIIRMQSPGPIFFKQKRVGLNGREFTMYKFRSMYQDAEARKAALMQQNEMNGLMFKMKDDPRITRVGRFLRRTSLDEFPQFLNVLIGDMSLVGTRPPTESEFDQYDSYHKRRLSMKPGITGLWQVSGRSEITDFEEIVRLDCRYIDEWNFFTDLRILWRTVILVLERKGSE